MLELSTEAVEVISDILKEGGVGPDGGLRISGAMDNGETALDFELAEAPVEGDDVVKVNGAVVFLDGIAAAALDGQRLDVHAHGDHFHFSIEEQTA